MPDHVGPRSLVLQTCRGCPSYAPEDYDGSLIHQGYCHAAKQPFEVITHNGELQSPPDWCPHPTPPSDTRAFALAVIEDESLGPIYRDFIEEQDKIKAEMPYVSRAELEAFVRKMVGPPVNNLQAWIDPSLTVQARDIVRRLDAARGDDPNDGVDESLRADLDDILDSPSYD